MNKINYYVIVTLLCVVATSCKDNEDKLDDGGLELAVQYNYYTASGVRNLFADSIRRLDFLVFNYDSTLVKVESIEHPQVGSDGMFHYYFQLGGGHHEVICWANGEKGWTRQFTIGQSMAQTRVLLNALENNTAYGDTCTAANPISPLYWGRTKHGTVRVMNGFNVNDTIDLGQATHNINLQLRWIDSNGVPCLVHEHEKTAYPVVTGRSGELSSFLCKPQWERHFRYLSSLKYGNSGAITDEACVRAYYRTSRLMASGDPSELIIYKTEDEVTSFYSFSLVELIRRTGAYNDQFAIDNEPTYNILVELRCPHPEHQKADTWTVATIAVNGWVLKNVKELIL